MPTLDELRASTADGRLPAFAFPGGYPMAYYTAEGLTICPACADEPDTSDPVEAGEIYWEGPVLACEDCGGTIESAYGDPEDPQESRVAA